MKIWKMKINKHYPWTCFHHIFYKDFINKCLDVSCDEKDISTLKILGKMLDEDEMMAEERKVGSKF